MMPNQPTPSTKKRIITSYDLLFPTYFSAVLLLIISNGLFSPLFAQQSKVDSLQKVLQNEKIDTSRVKTLYQLSVIFIDAKPDKAIEYANQALTLAQKIRFKNGESICLNALGLAYYQVGELDTAQTLFEKRLEIANKIKDQRGVAEVFDNLSIINIRWGKNEEALELRQKANIIYTSLNDKNSLAKGYDWIGSIYKEEGEYSNALEYYFKCIKIYEDENNEQNIGYPLLNISSIYRYLKQFVKAKEYALNAYSKFSKTKNSEGIGGSLYRLALIYGEENDFENTIKYLTEAKKVFEGSQNKYFLTLTNLLLGSTYHKNGNNDIAIGFFNSALPIAIQMGDKNVVSVIFQNIGTIFYDKGKYVTALEYFHKSERILKEIKDTKSLMEISTNFIEIFSQTNQPDSISKYFKIYQQLSDSLFNLQSTKAIVEMQTKYETEKKDKEILTLNLEAQKRKNTVWLLTSGIGFLFVFSGSGFVIYRNKKKKEQTLLKLKALELNHQLSETSMRALRSQMNPHFIFNCVHTIDRLLNDTKINESKLCLGQFSNLTRSVLENSTKREIPLDEEIETLQLYMELENLRFKNPFAYHISIGPDIDPNTTLVPPLIMQPFVENSIKHGFCNPKKQGHLKIDIQQENGSLVCVVEDNGIGRMQSQLTEPLSNFKKESIGIKLTEDRLKLLNETRKINSHFLIEDLFDAQNNPAGTRIKMFLPYELSV